MSKRLRKGEVRCETQRVTTWYRGRGDHEVYLATLFIRVQDTVQARFKDVQHWGHSDILGG